jgi:hypothetical protein
MIARHVIAAGVFCLAVPAASWLDGSGSLAWTMFSKSETYRLDVQVINDDGRRRIVNPTELAAFVSADLASILSGAESWRHAPVGGGLQRSIPGLARLACRLSPSAARTSVKLERRVHLDAPVETTEARMTCSP